MATPLQKLIWPTTEQAYLRDGSALLAGPVVRIADAIGWTTAPQVLTAYGLDAPDAPSVDVLRFRPSPLAQLRVPSPGSPAAVAGHGNGFLRGAGVVPVWDIAPTEVPQGAEIWRIFADGRQELVSAYGGPAFGWRATAVFAPPSMVVGPRAEWQGAEYRVSWIDETTVELVTVGETAPEGFEQSRPHVFRRVVAAAECSRFFEDSFSAVWNGDVRCRVMQFAEDEASVLLSVNAERAAALEAVELEPGVYWKVVPRAELSEIRGVATELAPPVQS
ncbi:hypothetical protein [Microbacterium sp. NPDC089696]|uniref:hypothetical protein n=1 Tax=Microbacterium sp. NPDC089696 TaxID=3364199 RepID=UPI00382A5677